MAQRFTDRIVFITGGTSGLGKATALLFAAEGAKLFLTDLEERDVLKSMPESASAQFQTCDVSDPVACETAINACM
jgi:NAD(P)-dependent dehydrogenase (short-subunit alcohol dehydrogenase family)